MKLSEYAAKITEIAKKHPMLKLSIQAIAKAMDTNLCIIVLR